VRATDTGVHVQKTWFQRWIEERRREQKVDELEGKIAGMEVKFYSGDKPELRYPVTDGQEVSRGSIDDDFTMARLLYEAVKAIPEKRRGDIMEFVIKRIDLERREAESARFSTQMG
jgi:hypothetical protein